MDVREQRRLRVGVVGCGLIAQSMHLPLLRELPDRFEVVALCDLSPAALDFCGERWFPQARRFEHWEDALEEPLDAVLVLTSGSHAPVAIAAAQAGMHVFVEKPVALSVEEGLAMCDAADAASVCLMAGYMKRFDPAYEELQRRAAALENLRLVRVTTLEAPLEPYVAHDPMGRGGDVPDEALASVLEPDRARVAEAIGPDAAADPVLGRAYRFVLLDCLVHEFNALRGVLGEPSELRYAAVAGEATEVTTVLRFGEVECIQLWAELDGLVRYEQELAFYADGERLSLSFPSPFLRNMPARLVAEGGAPGGISTWRSEHTVSYEEAFQRELVEFHEAGTTGREPRTPARDGVRDVALCEAWVRCVHEGGPIPTPTAVDAVAAAEGDAA
jgi:predicted dehydrogenase